MSSLSSHARVICLLHALTYDHSLSPSAIHGYCTTPFNIPLVLLRFISCTIRIRSHYEIVFSTNNTEISSQRFLSIDQTILIWLRG